MSAPGAPPETGYEDEGALPPNARPATDLPPEETPWYSRPTDVSMGAPRPDDRYPASFGPDAPQGELPVTAAGVSQTEAPQTLPKPRSALFNPLPIEEMEPRLKRRDETLPPSMLSPAPISQTAPKLEGGVPVERSGGTNTKISAAVDKAIGMEGMHERVNQADIQQYLATGGAGMNPAKVAWCAAFVNATLKAAGSEGSGSQVATSFMRWGEPVVDAPQKGDVMVRTQGKGYMQIGGHVGFATGKTRGSGSDLEIEMISGNQNNRVSRTWESSKAVQVRRMVGSSGTLSSIASGPKVPTQAFTGAAPPLTAAQQGARGFVPYPTAEVVAPASPTAPVLPPPPPGAVPALHPETGKPVIQNPDGTISTERTITVTDDKGKFINIPTIIDGKQQTEKQAYAAWVKGKNPPVEGPFATLAEAVTAAKTRSQRLGAVPPTTASPQTEAAVVTKTAESPAQELDRLSQTKPWATPQGQNEPFEGLPQKFPMTAAIPSQSFELPPEMDPTQKEGDPLASLIAPQWGEGQRFRDIKDELAPQWGEDIFERPTRGPMSVAPEPMEERNFSPAQYTIPDYVPLSKNFDIMTEPMPLSPEPMTDNQKLWNTVDYVTRPTRQGVKGFFGLSKAPYALGALGTGLLALPGKLAAPDAEPSQFELAHHWFVKRMEAAGKGAEQIAGLSADPEPRHAGEKIAEILGESVTPIKGAASLAAGPIKHVGGRIVDAAQSMTVPMTMATFGVNTAARTDSPANVFNWYMSEADAAPRKAKKEKDSGAAPFEPAVPGHTAAGNVDIGALSATVNATKHINDLGEIVLIPNASMFGRANLTPEMAIKQYERYGANFGKFETEEAADNYLRIINERVSKQIPTVAGPAEMKLSDFVPMGVAVASVVGVAYAPQLMNKLMFGKLFQRAPTIGREIEGAHPDVRAYSTRRELLRQYDDVNAVPSLVAQRAGVPLDDVQALEKIWSTHSRGAASNLATSAVENGIAQTPSLKFKVPTSLGKLENVVDDPFKQYSLSLTALEDIGRRERALVKSGQQPATPGPVTFRDQDRAYWGKIKTDMETQNPELRIKSGVVKQNNKEMNKFESNGDYGTVKPEEAARRTREEPYNINYGSSGPAEGANPVTAMKDDFHTRIRARTENEAKGITIDMMNAHRPNTFVQVSAEQIRQYPEWKDSLIEVKRKGVTYTYSTDPLLAANMRMDPYYAKEWAGKIIHGTRKGFEHTATGVFAPFFAPTSMYRSHNIVKTTAPALGWKAPNISQTHEAIFQQLTPKFQHFVARSLDAQYGNWLGQHLGPMASPWLKGLGKRWEAQFKASQDVQLQGAGMHYGSILVQREQTNKLLDSAIMKATGPFRVFLKGWQNVFSAMHNAPAYATVRLNRRLVTREEMALEGRRLTGDPQAGGEYFSRGKPVPFAHEKGLGLIGETTERALTGAAQVYGFATEAGRTFVPWFNVSQQGLKRIGRAWVQDPFKFAMAMYTTQQAPALAAFLWNHSLGKDPTGISYVEYQMNQRSPYNTMLNHYIAIPGRPAAEGIELPGKYHETAIFSRLFEIGLDHMFRTAWHGGSKDMSYAAGQAVNVIFSWPHHPLGNALFALKGISGGQGPFEGEAYRRRNWAFDQNVGLPVNVEMFARAFGSGVADILGSGAHAAIVAEGWDKPGAFASQATKKLISRTPILRNVAGLTPPQAGNTRVVAEVFERQGVFKMLDEYYRNFGVEGGDIKMTNKPASESGGRIANRKLGPPPPDQSPGLGQPKPTNELYRNVMAMVHDRLTKDASEKKVKGGGVEPAPGVGQRSLWQRYSRATKAIRTLNHINDGNLVTWQQRMTEPGKEDVLMFLQQNRVDYKNPTAVKNFYEGIRQNAAREILQTINQLEDDISKKIGKPFKLEHLDPYRQEFKLPPWLAKNDVLEHLQGMLFTAEVPEGGYVPQTTYSNP